MTYTEDRETFERQLFRPPHVARLTERTGPYVSRLDDADRTALLQDALDQMWELRNQIHETQDILDTWSQALAYAAERRPRWRVAISFAGICTGYKWVKGSHLGRRS